MDKIIDLTQPTHAHKLYRWLNQVLDETVLNKDESLEGFLINELDTNYKTLVCGTKFREHRGWWEASIQFIDSSIIDIKFNHDKDDLYIKHGLIVKSTDIN